jgi:signal transduction histidine kinase
LYLSSEGIIQYHPDRVSESFSTFNTVISRVEHDGEVLYGSYDYAESFIENGLGLTYKNNSVRFSYSAIFFEEADKNTFQYKLEGYDKKWSDWTKEAYKEYTNLPEGIYTFKVRSKNLYGVEGKEATFSFSVFPPWYRSSLAFGGYGLLLLVFVWIVVRVNTYRLIKEKEKLEQIVKERTQEISEQKDEIALQADQLKDTNQQLVDLGRFKQDMTSMIVHDLKSPLSVIIKGSEKKSASIARRMLNLVLNMLDVQKFEETDVQPSLAEHSMNELVGQAIEQIEGAMTENGLQLNLNAPKALNIAMDASLMERVLVNLMTNAIRYAPVNSMLSIELSQNKENELYFSLKDQGQGISEAKQKVIFDRYAQGDEEVTNRSQSTGLGLTFCKMVVEAHGGQIGVQSALGEGAMFWFTIPEAKEVSEASTIQLNTDTYVLSADDKERLKTILPALSQLKIYQSTEIENTLSELKASEGSGLSVFVQKLINASYNGDEEGFNTLLTEIE